MILAHPSGIIIDEIHYDNGDTFPDEEGASMMLLDPTLDNSLGENWEAANIIFGTGDFGTPGETNHLDDCQDDIGDMNADGGWNILDVVTLANCVLAANCQYNCQGQDTGQGFCYGCAGDMNGDDNYNILDIVLLVNLILD